LGEALGRGRGLGLGAADGLATLTVDDGFRCRQSLHAFTNRSWSDEAPDGAVRAAQPQASMKVQ
jgi:hypothetical protein